VQLTRPVLVGRGRAERQPRVQDEEVDVAVRGGEALGEGEHVLAVLDVENLHMDVDPVGLDAPRPQRLQAVLPAGHQHQPAPGLGEAQGHGLPDPRACSRDQGDLALHVLLLVERHLKTPTGLWRVPTSLRPSRAGRCSWLSRREF